MLRGNKKIRPKSLSSDTRQRFKLFFTSCSPFRSKYVRLIDNIYPVNSENNPLNKQNLEKLTFYSMRQPQKLDRISRYLLYRLLLDTRVYRYKSALISIDITDHLLGACRSSSNLNVFVGNYLQMLKQLIESKSDDLLHKCVISLRAYSYIEAELKIEQSYNFFLSKFSDIAICQLPDNLETTKNKKLANRIFYSLIGIESLLRKMSIDSLINSGEILQKLVVVLLQNIQNYEHFLNKNTKYEKIYESPNFYKQKTESFDGLNETQEKISFQDINNGLNISFCLTKITEIFQTLVKKSTTVNIDQFLLCVETYFNSMQLWDNSFDFTKRCLEMIIFAIERRYAFFVLKYFSPKVHQNETNEIDFEYSFKRLLLYTHILKSSIHRLGVSLSNAILVLIKFVQNFLNITESNHNINKSNVTTIMNHLLEKIDEISRFLDVHQFYGFINTIVDHVNLEPSKNGSFNLFLLQVLLIAIDKQNLQYCSTLFSGKLMNLISFTCRFNNPEERLFGMKILWVILNRKKYKKNSNCSTISDSPTMEHVDSNYSLDALPLLLDNNLSEMSELKVVSNISRQDIGLWKRNRKKFIKILFHFAISPNNTLDHYFWWWRVLIGFCQNLGILDTAFQDVHKIALILQAYVLNENNYFNSHLENLLTIRIHALVAGIMRLLIRNGNATYSKETIMERNQSAKYLLPENIFHSSSAENYVSFDTETIKNFLFKHNNSFIICDFDSIKCDSDGENLFEFCDDKDKVKNNDDILDDTSQIFIPLNHKNTEDSILLDNVRLFSNFQISSSSNYEDKALLLYREYENECMLKNTKKISTNIQDFTIKQLMAMQTNSLNLNLSTINLDVTKNELFNDDLYETAFNLLDNLMAKLIRHIIETAKKNGYKSDNFAKNCRYQLVDKLIKYFAKFEITKYNIRAIEKCLFYICADEMHYTTLLSDILLSIETKNLKKLDTLLFTLQNNAFHCYNNQTGYIDNLTPNSIVIFENDKSTLMAECIKTNVTVTKIKKEEPEPKSKTPPKPVKSILRAVLSGSKSYSAAISTTHDTPTITEPQIKLPSLDLPFRIDKSFNVRCLIPSMNYTIACYSKLDLTDGDEFQEINKIYRRVINDELSMEESHSVLTNVKKFINTIVYESNNTCSAMYEYWNRGNLLPYKRNTRNVIRDAINKQTIFNSINDVIQAGEVSKLQTSESCLPLKLRNEIMNLEPRFAIIKCKYNQSSIFLNVKYKDSTPDCFGLHVYILPNYPFPGNIEYVIPGEEMEGTRQHNMKKMLTKYTSPNTFTGEIVSTFTEIIEIWKNCIITNYVM
ncbi:hypothetical protein A3Q56_01734 [Intoshia linei]|uniref:Uncharacterized protein n=1 Tax=Intoshia linei TaxID=1819745 RepID=A0A177BAF9_9BILA|nr:hypothetical protein A3Q56_01734 [Intoshia linei]